MSTTPAPADLVVAHVSRRFGGLVAVDDASLVAERGHVTALIGPNGAGKTTLFQIICGYLPAHSGEVRLGAATLTGLPPHAIAAAGVRRTFQVPAVFSGMSVLDNVLVGMHHWIPSTMLGAMLFSPRKVHAEHTARGEALACLRRVSLDDASDMHAGQLSLGEQRRLEVARALAGRPALILLDEPASGLEAREREALSTLLVDLAQSGLGVLVVEHDVGLVLNIADKVVVLDRGRKIAEGSPDAIECDPDVIAAYLGTSDLV